MKSNDIQNLVLSKLQKKEQPKKIFEDLNGTVGLWTIERWCKMYREEGSINLRKPTGCPRTIRTKATIQKVERKMSRKIPPSAIKLAVEMGLSETTVRRVFREDVKLKPYKIKVKPLLTDQHRENRKRFANWIRTNFRKEDTMRILFSDEKMFDIDGVYNSQNQRIWAPSRVEADAKGGIKRKIKFPPRVMVWLAVCSKGVSPLVIFENDTVNHERYINEALSVALKYGRKTFGDNWTFQQDNATPHTHEKRKNGVQRTFRHLLIKIGGQQIVRI